MKKRKVGSRRADLVRTFLNKLLPVRLSYLPGFFTLKTAHALCAPGSAWGRTGHTKLKTTYG